MTSVLELSTPQLDSRRWTDCTMVHDIDTTAAKLHWLDSSTRPKTKALGPWLPTPHCQAVRCVDRARLVATCALLLERIEEPLQKHSPFARKVARAPAMLLLLP